MCKWRGSYSGGMPSLPSSLIPLLVFSFPNPRMSYCGISLRPNWPESPTSTSESTRIDKASVTMSKNDLRACYELATNFFNREFVAEILNSSKLCPRIPD